MFPLEHLPGGLQAKHRRRITVQSPHQQSSRGTGGTGSRVPDESTSGARLHVAGGRGARDG